MSGAELELYINIMARNRISFKITHPDLFKYWSPKNHKDPNKFSRKSTGKFWWRCLNNPTHEWEKCLINQKDDFIMECPFCNNIGSNKELMSYWHPSKNINIDPFNISNGSNIKIWFRCKFDITHEWIRSPKVIFRRGGKTKCLICEDKKPCFNYSQTFESKFPELLHEWDYESNSFLPKDIGARGEKIINWKCKYNHKWSRSANNSTRKIKNTHTRCPICLNEKVDSNNCAAATHPYLLEEWHPDNKTTLNDVTYGSNKKFKWQCLKHDEHTYITSLKHKTREDPTGCPLCSKRISKGEKSCLDFLVGENGVRNKSLIINNRIFYPDFMWKEHKLIIEYNGDKWHGNPDYFNPNDKIGSGKTYGEIYSQTFERKEFLEKNGWTVIFIWEHEWNKVKKLLY